MKDEPGIEIKQPTRKRLPGIPGTNVHSGFAGISVHNALLSLGPPPPDAKNGSKHLPWLQLTDWEIMNLRKRMKKNAEWKPSDEMIMKELADIGRGPLAYARTMEEARNGGAVVLNENGEVVQDSLRRVSLPDQPFTELNRGMKLNEAKKRKREAHVPPPNGVVCESHRSVNREKRRRLCGSDFTGEPPGRQDEGAHASNTKMEGGQSYGKDDIPKHNKSSNEALGSTRECEAEREEREVVEAKVDKIKKAADVHPRLDRIGERQAEMQNSNDLIAKKVQLDLDGPAPSWKPQVAALSRDRQMRMALMYKDEIAYCAKKGVGGTAVTAKAVLKFILAEKPHGLGISLDEAETQERRNIDRIKIHEKPISSGNEPKGRTSARSNEDLPTSSAKSNAAKSGSEAGVTTLSARKSRSPTLSTPTPKVIAPTYPTKKSLMEVDASSVTSTEGHEMSATSMDLDEPASSRSEGSTAESSLGDASLPPLEIRSSDKSPSTNDLALKGHSNMVGKSDAVTRPQGYQSRVSTAATSTNNDPSDRSGQKRKSSCSERQDNKSPASTSNGSSKAVLMGPTAEKRLRYGPASLHTSLDRQARAIVNAAITRGLNSKDREDSKAVIEQRPLLDTVADVPSTSKTCIAQTPNISKPATISPRQRCNQDEELLKSTATPHASTNRSATVQEPVSLRAEGGQDSLSLKQAVDEAAVRSNELGDPVYGQAIQKLFEQSQRNPTIDALLRAILLKKPSASQSAEWVSRIKAARIKHQQHRTLDILSKNAPSIISPSTGHAPGVDDIEPRRPLIPGGIPRITNTKRLIPPKDFYEESSLSSPSSSSRMFGNGTSHIASLSPIPDPPNPSKSTKSPPAPQTEVSHGIEDHQADDLVFPDPSTADNNASTISISTTASATPPNITSSPSTNQAPSTETSTISEISSALPSPPEARVPIGVPGSSSVMEFISPNPPTTDRNPSAISIFTTASATPPNNTSSPPTRQAQSTETSTIPEVSSALSSPPKTRVPIGVPGGTGVMEFNRARRRARKQAAANKEGSVALPAKGAVEDKHQRLRDFVMKGTFLPGGTGVMEYNRARRRTRKQAAANKEGSVALPAKEAVEDKHQRLRDFVMKGEFS